MIFKVEEIPGMNTGRKHYSPIHPTLNTPKLIQCAYNLLSGLLDCGRRLYMRRSPIQSHVAMESAPASLPNMSVRKGVLGLVYAMVGGEVGQQGKVEGRGGA